MSKEAASMAKDYLADNIRCNCISPERPDGQTRGKRRTGTLSRSDEAALITGANYLIDGGFITLNN